MGRTRRRRGREWEGKRRKRQTPVRHLAGRQASGTHFPSALCTWVLGKRLSSRGGGGRLELIFPGPPLTTCSTWQGQDYLCHMWSWGSIPAPHIGQPSTGLHWSLESTTTLLYYRKFYPCSLCGSRLYSLLLYQVAWERRFLVLQAQHARVRICPLETEVGTQTTERSRGDSTLSPLGEY